MKLNIVPAKTGALWVKQGARTFVRQPIALTGLFLMFMALMSLVSMVPLIGGVIGLMLIPSASLGLMAGAQEALSGKFPRPMTLFCAFRVSKDKTKQMLLLGVFYAAGFLVLAGLSALVDGGGFAKFYLVGSTLTKELILKSDFQQAMWLALILYIPFSSLFWHAPALVFWHGVSVPKSLFFSGFACFSNWRAFLMYTLTWAGVFASVALVLGMLSSLGEESAWVSDLLLPVMLILASIFFTSSLFSFKDCFSSETILA
jgi:hypothetical protein